MAPPSLRLSFAALLLVCVQGVLSQDFSIAGYLPDYRSYIDVNATAPFLTDLILFSIEPRTLATHLEGTCCLGENHYRIARLAQIYKKERGAELRLWVSVGGGGRSEAFASIVADQDKRTNFIQELIQLCHGEGLQGVDLDWEIPRTHQELQSYVELLLQASKALHAKNLLLSVALHARQFMPPQVYHAVDRVHLMAYDLAAPHYAQYDSVVQAVQEFVQYQCPLSKLVLGIPAFGRHFENPSLVRTFAELMDESSDEAMSRQEWNGYRYDSPESVQKKVEYAVRNGLAGVFFWELGQDKQHAELGPGGILLEAAASFVKRRDQNTEL